MSDETQNPGTHYLAQSLARGRSLVLQPEPSNPIPPTQNKLHQFKQITNKSAINFLGSPPGLSAFLTQ
jgi:hypothetical protein